MKEIWVGENWTFWETQNVSMKKWHMGELEMGDGSFGALSMRYFGR